MKVVVAYLGEPPAMSSTTREGAELSARRLGGRVLEEPSALSRSLRQPCPACGAATRKVEVSAAGSVGCVGESLRLRKRAAKVGWVLDTRSGDDYTRDLDAK